MRHFSIDHALYMIRIVYKSAKYDTMKILELKTNVSTKHTKKSS